MFPELFVEVIVDRGEYFQRVPEHDHQKHDSSYQEDEHVRLYGTT